MTDKQSDALRLADELEQSSNYLRSVPHQAASELRRLHEVNAELVEALRQAKSFVFMKSSKPDDFELHNRIQAALGKAQGDNE